MAGTFLLANIWAHAEFKLVHYLHSTFCFSTLHLHKKFGHPRSPPAPRDQSLVSKDEAALSHVLALSQMDIRFRREKIKKRIWTETNAHSLHLDGDSLTTSPQFCPVLKTVYFGKRLFRLYENYRIHQELSHTHGYLPITGTCSLCDMPRFSRYVRRKEFQC